MTTPSLDKDWGKLRSIMQQPAEPRTWSALMSWLLKHLDALKDEGMMEYMSHSLTRWPDHLRVVPDEWMGLLYMGQSSPFFELCRTLHIHQLTDPEREQRVRRTWAHPDLDLDGPMSWAAEMIVDGPHSGYLDFLWANEELQHITTLVFSNNVYSKDMWWDNPDAVKMGAETFSPKQMHAMANSPTLSALAHIMIDGTMILKEHITALLDSPLRRTLKTLQINDILGQKAFNALYTGGLWHELETLNLLNHGNDWSQMHQLLTSVKFPSLRHLDLSGGSSHMEPTHQIPAPPHKVYLQALESLNVSNPGGALDADPLCDYHMPESVHTLASRRGNWDSASFERLCKTPWFHQIQDLDVSFNQETLAAQDALANLNKYHKPARVVLSHKQDETITDDTIITPAPPPTDLHIPEPGEAWWAWKYDQPLFAGRPIWHWRDVNPHLHTPYHERAPSPAQPDGVPRAHINKAIDPHQAIVNCPEPAHGMMSFGTSRQPEAACEAFIEKFGETHKTSLKMLTWHDVSNEEEQPSWINNSNVSPLLHAFPNLEFFGVKGGYGLEFKALSHPHLRALTIITGGMPVDVIRDLELVDLPSLEVLELWLGIEEYGLSTTVEDLEPILTNQRRDGSILFPNLKQLGICNTLLTDEIVNRLITSPLLAKLETLDLRHGTATDRTIETLLRTPATLNLRRLLLNRNRLGDRNLTDQLSIQGVQVSWGDWHHWAGSYEEHYLEVTE